MHPALVRRLILPLHERLLGRRTLARAAELELTQWCSAGQLRRLQTRRLRELLESAADHIPFYRERIASAGIDPRRATIDDLQRLPCLTKDEIRPDPRRLCADRVFGGLHVCNTGGSTGEPLPFFIDRSRQAADQAARIRSRRWFGIEPGERELYLWGSPVELSRQDRAKSLRDRLVNQRLLNAFDMTPARMDDFLDQLVAFRPVHLFGYPSSLARLVAHARRRGRTDVPNSLRTVFVSGEWLDPDDRRAIAEFFGVPVADGYGARDAGFVAHECPHGLMHVTADSLIVELLDRDGRPVPPGANGEVVVTHLEAFGMPFIRYRTGDIAVADDRPCPCGRGLPVLRDVQGRRTDLLRTAGGGVAHGLSVIYVLRETPGILQFRVMQRRTGDLDVSVVTNSELADDDRRRLEQSLGRRLGGVCAHVRRVESIPPDPSGKFRYVTSEA
ncbi:MAG: AMP-binding protein [Phycisphaerae bacterium]|nr:AMP-binding protein [Phycisphaerae bacterium]